MMPFLARFPLTLLLVQLLLLITNLLKGLRIHGCVGRNNERKVVTDELSFVVVGADGKPPHHNNKGNKDYGHQHFKERTHPSALVENPIFDE